MDDHPLDDAAAVMAAARDAIVATDRHGVIHAANPALSVLLGVPAGVLSGRSLASLAVPADRRRLEGALWSALRGNAARAELDFDAGAGVRRLAFGFGPMRDAPDDVVGVVGVGRDVTDQRSIEAQFARADKLATVGRLAAGVVHEINNPLTAIRAYSDHLARRLRSQSSDPRDLEHVLRIAEAADRIQDLVRRLLAYSPSSCEQPARVDLGDIVAQATVYCEHVLRERGVEISRRVSTGVPAVHGVRGELIQVVVNLLTNACHACPRDGGWVEVVVDAPSPAHVRLVVQDNGHGIAPENLAKIFEPFFTTRGNGVGTGLGLSIVRTILEQHRAELTVESEVHRGTRITVLLAAEGEAVLAGDARGR